MSYSSNSPASWEWRASIKELMDYLQIYMCTHDNIMQSSCGWNTEINHEKELESETDTKSDWRTQKNDSLKTISSIRRISSLDDNELTICG